MTNDLFTLVWFLLILFAAVAIHVRDDVIRAQDKRTEELGALCNEALWQRDEARLALAHHHERAGAYLREAAILVDENERLKRGEYLDADAIVEDVERWLEAK